LFEGLVDQLITSLQLTLCSQSKMNSSGPSVDKC
jgi:hypothetical protein